MVAAHKTNTDLFKQKTLNSIKISTAIFSGFLFFAAVVSSVAPQSMAQSAPPQGVSAPPPDAPKPRKPSRPLMELSALTSFSRSSFGNGSFSKSQRFTGSAAVYLTRSTELEVSYTDSRVYYESQPAPRTTTRTTDKILGASLNQALTPRTWFIQPYIKLGAAQLNRTQKATYNGVDQTETTLKQPSGLAGAGLRLFMISFISLKFELTAYMPDFDPKLAKENYEWDAGVSFHF